MNEPFDLDAEAEALTTDLMLAIGALSAVPNVDLNRVAQGLKNARPLLAALIGLGGAHADELAGLLAHAKGYARVLESRPVKPPSGSTAT